ncbi:hypothetical protein GW17_00001914 [Ensete ventricosum]|nr:hypothetical protein GW17_00001914 [Ensete ventricosum]
MFPRAATSVLPRRVARDRERNALKRGPRRKCRRVEIQFGQRIVFPGFVETGVTRTLTGIGPSAVPPVDMNKNTEWFMYPGVWTTYILILFFSWLIFLSVLGCNPGTAWTIVNLVHFAKGTPFSDDQGIYNSLTWWEQIDSGKQLTRNRKFLTVVPVVLYLIASHTTDYRHPMLFLNTVAVIVLVIAKLPNMHKVRIFGINAGR